MGMYELVLAGLYLINTGANHGSNPAAPVSSEPGVCSLPTTLAAAKGCYRPLILFTPSASDPRAMQQLGLLNRHEMEERDVLLIFLPAARSNTKADLPSAAFSEEEGRQLRQRFKIGSETFAVILVGKDGGEKLRRKLPISGVELNSTIDAMPMRRQEASGTLPKPSP